MIVQKHSAIRNCVLAATIIRRTMASKNSAQILGKSKFIKKEEKARGKWVAFNIITYQDPTGKERTWEGVERTTTPKDEADAVCIMTVFRDPIKKCDCVILVRQYRPAMQAYTIEFPAGLIDAGETASAAAVREMREETGYTVKVKHVTPATSLDGGIENATLKMAVCEVDKDTITDKHEVVPAGGEADEFTEVLIEPMNTLLTKLIEYSNNGEIVDSRVYSWALAKADIC